MTILKPPCKVKLENFTSDIEKDLTVTISDYMEGDEEFYHFYHILGNEVILPKYYPVKDATRTLFTVEESTDINKIKPTKIDITDTIKLRSESQEAAVKYLVTNDHGILKAKPGFGKTIVSIKSISEMKYKTLIVVKRKVHATQWMDKFIEFTNIKLEDIGIGQIPLSELKDKKIVIMTVNRIYNMVINNDIEGLNQLNDCNFGITFWDECQSSATAKHFSKACLCVNSHKVFGLSATPKNEYTMKNISRWILGDTFEPKDEFNYKPAVYTISWQSKMDAGKHKWISYGDKFQKTRYCKQISKHEEYYQIWSRKLRLAMDKRTILCLADRYEIVEKLIEVMKKIDKETGLNEFGKKKHLLFRASSLMKSKDKDDVKISDLSELGNYDIIFTTYQMFSDAMDVPGLDCLFMLTPNNNVEQTIGRIIRTKNEKKQPIVIDMVDTDFSDLTELFEHRLRNYNKFGWEHKFVNNDSDNKTIATRGVV